MTKYVLNSGGLRNHPQKGKKFLTEIVKDLGPSPKMLVTLFAQPREDWEEKFAKYRDELNDHAPKGVSLSFALAFPHLFEQQVANSDIIYIHGGDTHLLHYWFGEIGVPKKLWQGKVVAGSSAGSDMMAKAFWTCDWRQCMDGFGVLPIKFIPHFKSDFGNDDPRGPINWDKAYEELSNYGDKKLPIYALEEGDFVVINQ